MKTIAIMTMIFLPPTFFATLFAMPLLKWDGSKVMQSNFGFYLAFSLPTTAFVLLVWHCTSSEQTIFVKGWAWMRKKKENEDLQIKDVEKNPAGSTPFRWTGIRYRPKT